VTFETFKARATSNDSSLWHDGLAALALPLMNALVIEAMQLTTTSIISAGR